MKNTTIPKTHAVDLVNDLLRKRTSSLPTGLRQLADLLKDSNIPHELIGNKDRWAYINASSEETQPVTSSLALRVGIIRCKVRSYGHTRSRYTISLILH